MFIILNRNKNITNFNVDNSSQLFYSLHSGEIQTCDSNVASPAISYAVLDRGIPFKTRGSLGYLFSLCRYIVHAGSPSYAKVEHSYEIFHEPKWYKQAKKQLSLIHMEIFASSQIQK